MTNTTPLLRSRRFLPLFTAQWFGAFSDNALKSAFAFLIAYQGVDLFGLSPSLAVLIGSAVFVLPYLLVSGVAGKLSDAVDKARVVRATRLAEIGLAGLAGTAVLIESAPLALVAIFFYGVQSAVFGPAKYAILPQHLPREVLEATGSTAETEVVDSPLPTARPTDVMPLAAMIATNARRNAYSVPTAPDVFFVYERLR